MARIAVVGSGIAGLACADLLQTAHDVVVFEAQGRLGGHARTLTVPDARGPMAVDTGFIVYNEVNYPLLTKLFVALGVETSTRNHKSLRRRLFTNRRCISGFINSDRSI